MNRLPQSTTIKRGGHRGPARRAEGYRSPWSRALPLDLLTRLDPLRRIRCPFCLGRFAAYQIHFRCGSTRCVGDYARMIEDPILSEALHGAEAGGSAVRSPWWTDPARDEGRGLRRFLDWFVLPGSLNCPTCGRSTECRLCPRCHHELPELALAAEPGHLAIFGPQSVGKTTFLTVALHEIDQEVGPTAGLLLEALDEETRQRFKHEYEAITYGSGQLGVGDDGLSDATRQAHYPTPPLAINRRALQPLVYRVKRRGSPGGVPRLVSFCDLAGEDWEMNIETLRREGGHLIRRARGLLFLVDPLRLPAVARDPRLRLTDKERMVPAAEYSDDVRKLGGFFRRRPVRTPLSICLNKLDRWGELLAEGTILHEVARGVAPAVPDEAFDRAVHEEVRSALRRWGQSAFLEHLQIDFPDHRFFACSALGDAAPDREGAPQPLPTPLLVDRPLLWLLQRQGLLKGKAR